MAGTDSPSNTYLSETASPSTGFTGTSPSALSRIREIHQQYGRIATQEDNELILDRAFQTATKVFLSFSINESSEFCGYAR